MADGFIVRRGGKVSEQALAPTITEVSTTDSSITFTIKNEDTKTATIVYRIDLLTAEGESISLAGGATSSNITASGLAADTTFTVFATANVTGKVKSNVTQLAISTGLPPFTAATGGTTLEYDDGGKRYRSHTFTSDDDFIVSTVGDATDDRNKVDFLVIAGGAAGGHTYATGGGGAGGYRTSLGTTGGGGTTQSKITVTAKTYEIDVGAGGAASTTSGIGNDGTASIFDNVSTIGGGGGGIFRGPGNPGGSGGGGGGRTSAAGGAGTANEGFAGGAARSGDASGQGAGGGGGGAGEVGQAAVNQNAGNGGNGLANLLRTGSNETRAGGGGGGSYIDVSGGSAGSGGSGGGGNGATDYFAGTGGSGTVNTGSGGGGTNEGTSGAGGSGIVVIRYEIAPSV
jgi:hypothetical protein